MKQFLTTEETLQLLKLESPHQLIPLIQEGLEPHDKFDRPFPEHVRPFGPGDPYSPEEIDGLITSFVEHRKRCNRPSAVRGEHGFKVLGSTDQIHRQAAKEHLEKIPYFPRRPERSWKHLKLPYVEGDAERFIEKMKGWRFRASEVQALAKTTSQHAARFDEGTVTRIMNPASPQADARRTPTLEQIGQEVGEEAEAIYTMIDKKLGDERINITDASQIDVHDQFQAVLAQQQHSFTHLRSFNVPQDLFALSNGHQRQNFIAKMIQFAGDKYGYGKISLEKAKELYLGKK